MKQTQKITISTTANDLEKVIKSVEQDIAKLRSSLADKQELLEKLNTLLDSVKEVK